MRGGGNTHSMMYPLLSQPIHNTFNDVSIAYFRIMSKNLMNIDAGYGASRAVENQGLD